MYCRNCGTSVDKTNNYCPKCGTKIGDEAHTKTNPNAKKGNGAQTAVLVVGIISGLSILGIIILSICAVAVTSSFDDLKDELRSEYEYEYDFSSSMAHSREEMLDDLDNLDCSNSNINGVSITTNSDDRCNIKDKYRVIDEQLTYDGYNKEIRTLYIEMKDYDFKFNVISKIECTSFFDTACLYNEYVLSTDYQSKASSYFRNKYYGSQESSLITMKNDYQSFILKDKSSVHEASELLTGYIDFMNSLDFRYAYPEEVIDISFNEKNRIMVKVLLDDGKYIITDFHNYVIDDLEEFFLEYIKEKNIYN